MSYWDQKELEARLSGVRSAGHTEAQGAQQLGQLSDLDYQAPLLVVEKAKKPFLLRLQARVLLLHLNLRCLAVDFRKFINQCSRVFRECLTRQKT